MSVSRCLTAAANSASRTHRSEWKAQIEAQPETCPHLDICTGGMGCRARVADYLRVQFKVQARRERVGAGKRA